MKDIIEIDGVKYKRLEPVKTRAEALLYGLRLWQELNDEPVDWSNIYRTKWSIDYNGLAGMIVSTSTVLYQKLGEIYFSSQQKAHEAIETFHDELLWYFTKYQRIDKEA